MLSPTSRLIDFLISGGDRYVINTFEIRHTTLTESIKFCSDSVSFAGLDELGNAITFPSRNLSFVIGELNAGRIPSITLTIDNTDLSLLGRFTTIASHTEFASLIYRVYLSDYTTAPSSAVITLPIISCIIGEKSLNMVASHNYLQTRRFPNRVFNSETFGSIQRL